MMKFLDQPERQGRGCSRSCRPASTSVVGRGALVLLGVFFGFLAAGSSLACAATKPSVNVAVADTPPMGWNAWNAFRTDVDEAKLLDVAHALVDEGMVKAGYRYLNIDDGWWLERAADGTLRVRTNLFPSARVGTKKTSFLPFVNTLHALGLKAGIYTDIGRNTCSQVWDPHSPNLPEGSEAAREVGSYDHQVQDATLLFGMWHFDYVKVDACGIADYGPDSKAVRSGLYRAFTPLIVRASPSPDRDREVADLYASFQKAVLSASHGHPPVLEVCAWGEAAVADWAPRYSNVWRTSPDIEPTWRAMLRNFDTAAPRALFAGPGHWNDPDLLEVGNGEFDSAHLTEARAHLSMWAIIAAPLILSYDVRTPQKELADIVTNRDMISIDQDAAGNQGAIVAFNGDTETVIKSLSQPNLKAVALINRGTQSQPVSFSAEVLHLDPSRPISVRDVWRHTVVIMNGGMYTATLSPHETALLIVEGTRSDRAAVFLDEMPGRITPVRNDRNMPSTTWRDHFVPARIAFHPAGEPIILNGKPAPAAIAVAPDYRLRIDLGRQFHHFRTQKVLASEGTSSSPAMVSIEGDGRTLFSGTADAMDPLDLDVTGVQTLELRAMCPRKSACTDVVWTDPMLLR